MSISIAIIISLIVGSAVGLFIFYKKDKAYKNAWKYLTSTIRALVVAILVFLLLSPQLNYNTNEHKQPLIIWLQDNSTSVGDALGQDTNNYLNQRDDIINELGKDNRVEIYNFGEHINSENKTNFSEDITHIDFALQNIINRYQNDNLGAIILSSDGIFNRGSDPNYNISNHKNTSIYTVGIGDTAAPKDISIQRVYANKVVTVGNEFEIGFDAKYAQMNGLNSTINLLQNGQTIRSKNVTIGSDMEVVSESFVLTAQQAGIHHYQLQIPVAEGEKSEVNNTFDIFIECTSQDIKVLIVNNGSHPDIGFIKNAITMAKGFKVDIAQPQTLPPNFKDYDVLILHQPQLSASAWQSIADARQPAWHILGLATPPAQLEHINSALSYSNEQVQAQLQDVRIVQSFNLFRLPLSAQDVLAKMPPLESRVAKLTALSKPEVYLNNKQSDVWLFNNQKGIAVTHGEGLWKWGIYENKDFKSNNISHELIQQTLHALKKPIANKTLSVYLNKKIMTDQEHISISAEVRNSNAQLINSPEVTIDITGPQDYRSSFTFDRLGASYHLLIPPLEAGEYNYIAHTQFDGKTHQDRGIFIVENIPLEQMNTQANFNLLYNLAAQNNGQMYTTADMSNVVNDIEKNENINTVIVEKNINQPWIDYKWIFAIIMGLLTIEWLLRKYFAMQ